MPVIKFGTRTKLIQASIKKSPLWQEFKTIKLTQNMRTGPNEHKFSDWLIKMGNGELPFDNEDNIQLPEQYISKSELIQEVYENKLQNQDDLNYYQRAILAPKNENVFQINDEILSKLSGQMKTYKSIDTDDSGEEQTNFPTEFLNSLTPSGFPPHELKLKTGAVVMILRNLNIHDGLCNGTRMIITEMKDHVLKAKILGTSRNGQEVLLPKIDITSTDKFLPVELRRRQFPIRLAFAMTINKAQGQTFDKIGLYLPQPVFSHGQLYVAFSRVRNQESIKVNLESDLNTTKNIVYKEIL